MTNNNDLLQITDATDDLFFAENKESIREDGITAAAEKRYAQARPSFDQSMRVTSNYSDGLAEFGVLHGQTAHVHVIRHEADADWIGLMGDGHAR